MRLARNIYSSQSFPQESTDGGLGSLSTLTGQTCSRKGHSNWQRMTWRTGANEGKAVPNGEVKRPRPGVWEAEQAWARTNQVGSPVSVLCQGKQFSEMRQEGTLGQTQELHCMGARAQALAWPCGGCDSPVPLEAARSR